MQKMSQTEEMAKMLAGRARRHVLTPEQVSRAMEEQDFDPALARVGIPPELVPLMLVRPLSGSGALGVAGELISAHGPESYVGRVAAVMLGSTETTFYTVAVYFGAAGIRKTRFAIPAALTADAVGFLTAAATVRLFFGT